MNDHDVDAMLRDYAPRWRAAQPPAPTAEAALRAAATATPARRATERRVKGWWLPVVVAAAVVGLVVGGVGLVRYQAGPGPAEPIPTTSPGVVPWRDLPPARPYVPKTGILPSPDPALAWALPPCRVADLEVSHSRVEAFLGTRTLVVEFRSPTRPCRLEGYPTVTPLDRAGRLVAVPVTRELAQYGHPVALDGRTPALLRFTWLSIWCGDEVDVAVLRLSLPDYGGSVDVSGFGRSLCYGREGSGTTAPIVSAEFRPERFTTGEWSTQFDYLQTEATLPATVKAGEVMRFRITLTAVLGRDVALDPCPDLSIGFGDEPAAEYALNCPAVPYRDRDGRPYLPAGVPVAFTMQVTAPDTTHEDAKLIWQLIGTRAAAGGTVDVLLVR